MSTGNKPKAKPKAKPKKKAGSVAAPQKGSSNDTPTPARAAGRPCTYSRELSDRILDRISKGMSITKACKAEGMENHSTLLTWVYDDRDGIADRFTRAREIGCHAMAYDLIDILDTPPGINPMTGATDTGEVQNRRLQFDGKLRLLGKWLPKVYGDKIEIEGKLSISDELRKARERRAACHKKPS